MIALTRRTLLAGMATSLAAPAIGQSAFPSRPIRVFVPFAAGGIGDVTARIVADKLSALIGQQLVVMNQPGAGGTAAARAAIAAGADGHSLALLTNGTAVSVPLLANMGFDPLADFTPISQLGTFDFVFATSEAAPYKTLADLTAAARQRPTALNVGTILVGSTASLGRALSR